MMFSNKIYKINNGKNATLYYNDNNSLNLYLFDKSLKLYNILIDKNMNCVFLKNFNYEKIIQLNNNTICPCNNKFITITNENNI